MPNTGTAGKPQPAFEEAQASRREQIERFAAVFEITVKLCVAKCQALPGPDASLSEMPFPMWCCHFLCVLEAFDRSGQNQKTDLALTFFAGSSIILV